MAQVKPWVDKTLAFPPVNTSSVGASYLRYPVTNETGALIPANIVLTVSPTQSGGQFVNVIPLTNPQTQIAIGITLDPIHDLGTGFCLVYGEVLFGNTETWPINTLLYPNTGSGFTSTKPTSGVYQPCARVTRTHSVKGTLSVKFMEPIQIASVAQSGYVQLNDTFTSTSTTQALTANVGKLLKDTISDHILLLIDAHDATAISYDNTNSGLTATEIQSAVDEVEGRVDTIENDDTISRTDIIKTFTVPQRASIGAEDNAIDFSLKQNFELTATAVNITALNLTGIIGQSGTIIVHTAENVTGWGIEFKFKTIPTGLSGTEVFGYFIEDATNIWIGRVQ